MADGPSARNTQARTGASPVLHHQGAQPGPAGWANYFRLTANMRHLDELDWWLRRRLRCLLWRQWQAPRTRERKLASLGIAPERTWKSSVNGRGAWWNAGAKHMNQALPTSYFARMGLAYLRNTVQELQRVS